MRVIATASIVFYLVGVSCTRSAVHGAELKCILCLPALLNDLKEQYQWPAQEHGKAVWDSLDAIRMMSSTGQDGDAVM